jgi:hypothetical protein
MVGLALLIFLTLLGVLWVWPTVKAQEIGRRKVRENPWLWGFALGWIGVIVLASAPESVALPPIMGHALPATKPCPECGEYVKAAALICRFCRHDFATLV